MSKQQVTIDFSGPNGSGKTLMSNMLEILLREAGYEVSKSQDKSVYDYNDKIIVSLDDYDRLDIIKTLELIKLESI